MKLVETTNTVEKKKKNKKAVNEAYGGGNLENKFRAYYKNKYFSFLSASINIGSLLS